MKIVVIGGTGLIGSKTVAILRQGGHENVAQHKLVDASCLPYTTNRQTQFLEFLHGCAYQRTHGNSVRTSLCLFQPIAANVVAPIVEGVPLAVPGNSLVEIAGTERAPFN